MMWRDWAIRHWANMNNFRYTGNYVHWAFCLLQHAYQAGFAPSFQCPVRIDKAACNCYKSRPGWVSVCIVDDDSGFRSCWCWVLVLALNPSLSVLFMKCSALRHCEFSNRTPNKLGQICLQLHKWKPEEPRACFGMWTRKCSLLYESSFFLVLISDIW